MKKETFKNEAYIVDETDIMNYVTKSSTKEQRRKFNIGDIYINAAVCKNCNDYIRSQNAHDHKECSCGKVMVDGGSWQAKRGGKKKDRVDVIEHFLD